MPTLHCAAAAGTTWVQVHDACRDELNLVLDAIPVWVPMPDTARVSVPFEWELRRQQLVGARVAVRWRDRRVYWGTIPGDEHQQHSDRLMVQCVTPEAALCAGVPRLDALWRSAHATVPFASPRIDCSYDDGDRREQDFAVGQVYPFSGPNLPKPPPRSKKKRPAQGVDGDASSLAVVGQQLPRVADMRVWRVDTGGAGTTSRVCSMFTWTVDGKSSRVLLPGCVPRRSLCAERWPWVLCAGLGCCVLAFGGVC